MDPKISQKILSWKTILQLVVALSSTETKFIALSEAIKEWIWLKRLLNDRGIN